MNELPRNLRAELERVVARDVARNAPRASLRRLVMIAPDLRSRIVQVYNERYGVLAERLRATQ